MIREVWLAELCGAVPVVAVAARRRPCGERLTMLDGVSAATAFLVAVVANGRAANGEIALTLPGETG